MVSAQISWVYTLLLRVVRVSVRSLSLPLERGREDIYPSSNFSLKQEWISLSTLALPGSGSRLTVQFSAVHRSSVTSFPCYDTQTFELGEVS